MRLLPLTLLVASCSTVPAPTGEPSSEPPLVSEPPAEAKVETGDAKPPMPVGLSIVSLRVLVEDAESYYAEHVTTLGRLVWGEADCVPNCSVDWILVDVEDPEIWHYVVTEIDPADIVCKSVDDARTESPCGPDAEPDPDAAYVVKGEVDRDASGYSFMVESIERVSESGG